MFGAVALAVTMAVVGVGLTLLADVRLRLEERVPIGIVVGAITVSAGTFVGFELLGMTWGALLLGVALPGSAAAWGWARHGAAWRREVRSARGRLGLPARAPASLRPLAVLVAAATVVTTRTLSLAYQADGRGGLRVGSLSGYGDWAAHLAYAGSFAYGDNRALEQPLAAGEPLKYHVLANFFGSIFTVPGLALPQALVLSSWLLACTVVPLLFGVARRLTGSRSTAGLTVLLFTLTGGVGAWYLVGDVRAGGWDTLWHLPQTYARMPDRGLWVDNTISASLYAQRSTLLGLATGASAAIVLLAARPRWARSGFLFAGLLVGTTGISHVHTLVTALALGGLAWLADRRATWWWFLGPALAIGLPLTWAISPDTSAVRWLPGWMAPGADQAWAWFWLRNVGLLLPLVLGISLLGGVAPRLRRLTLPLWLWFVVPNVVAFHPGEVNNTKFFLFWQLGGCLLVADLVRRHLVAPALAARAPSARRSPVPWLGRLAVAVLLVASLTVTGGLDALRAMQRSSAIPWVDAGDVAAARWLRARAPLDARLVYGASNTSAVAALSGVPALTGYYGWTDDLGIASAGDRVVANRTILSGGPGAADLVRRYGVDYVAIGPRERYEAGASDSYWAEHGVLVFSQGQYQLYEVRP